MGGRQTWIIATQTQLRTPSEDARTLPLALTISIGDLGSRGWGARDSSRPNLAIAGLGSCSLNLATPNPSSTHNVALQAISELYY